MTQRPWGDDEALLAELREALTGAAPVPPDFTAAARAAMAWRTIDADLLLAELAYDSSVDAALATRAGPGTASRMLVFDGAGYRLEAEVGADGIVGQVLPVDGGMVGCQTADGTFDETVIDEVGFFTLRAPAGGPVRLHVQLDGQAIATSWVNLT